MDASIYVYPWDILETGIDELLDELEALNLNALEVAASYHAGKFLRPRGREGKLHFCEDGTTYFRPDASRYSRLLLQPRPSSLATERDFFPELAESAHRRGLHLSAWTVALHNSRLGAASPEATVVNAYGDHDIARLCPANPAVVEYLRALVGDISHGCGVDSIDLESIGFGAFQHGFHHEFYAFDIDPYHDLLLALCFCPHCQQKAREAGVEADAVRQSVRRELAAFFSGEIQAREGESAEGPLFDDEAFGAYLQVRTAAVTSLLAAAREDLARGVTLHVIPSLTAPVARAWAEGADLAQLSIPCDALTLLGYYRDPQQVSVDLAAASDKVGSRCALRMALRAYPPDAPNMDNLVAKASRIREADVAACVFYNYGHVRVENIRWIGQAAKALRS